MSNDTDSIPHTKVLPFLNTSLKNIAIHIYKIHTLLVHKLLVLSIYIWAWGGIVVKALPY